MHCTYIPTNVKSLDSLLRRIDDRSRSGVIGCDVIITPNPSYTIDPNSLETREESEYPYDYVQTDNELVQQDKAAESTTLEGTHNEVTDLAEDVNIDPNTSYSLPQDDQNIKLEDNPSYDKLLL